MDKKVLTQKIKDKALSLGFAKVGITTADDFTEYADDLRNRTPAYDFLIHKRNGPLAGAYPRTAMPDAKSIVCVVFNYSDIDYPAKLTQSIGRTYLGRCYDPLPDTLNGARLSLFRDFLRDNGCKIGEGVQIPERMACARAGITTFGRNNFAYADGCGSFIILNSFLIDTELEYDSPTVERRCPPNCHLCIDSCPTGALNEPGKLIPTRCLGFNHWFATEFVPEDIRVASGSRIHGCDICQEACPRNRKPLRNAVRQDPFLELLAHEFDLEKVLLMDEAYYRRVIHPIMYNYIRNTQVFQRNAAIALGNSGEVSHVPALAKALDTCAPLVREYAAWALGRIGGEQAKNALLYSNTREQTERVTNAISMALSRISQVKRQ